MLIGKKYNRQHHCLIRYNFKLLKLQKTCAETWFINLKNTYGKPEYDVGNYVSKWH